MAQDLDIELLQARMKAIQYESSLLNEVVKLQRTRIEQLEQRLSAAQAKLGQATDGVRWICRTCGKPSAKGQVFCRRACFYEYQRPGKRDARRNRAKIGL